MSHQGNKIKIALIVIIFLLTINSCNKYSKLDEKLLQRKRVLFQEKSMAIVGEKEYWQVYDQINDSIKNWRKNLLKGYDEDTTLVQFQIDSLLCFSKQGDKLITIRIGRGLGNEDVMDSATHYYGVKIKDSWYFFGGPTMYVPREFYQEDIHMSLSFEKLKQIATKHIYQNYLKRGKGGQWEINDGFFSDIISKNTILGGYGSCLDCKTEEEYVLYRVQQKWKKKDTINDE